MQVRKPLHAVLAVVLVAGLAAVAYANPGQAATSDVAFNSGTGALDVDYSSYLAKHDVVYNRPNSNPLHGLTVGNGRTGAMAWSQNGLSMQVSGVDLAPQSAYAAGNVNLFSNPGFDTGYSRFEQRLSLHDGTLTTRYDDNRTVTVMGSPGSEVMGIHVEDKRPEVTAVGLDLSLWDPTEVQNIAGVADLQTWRTVSPFADASGVGLSRGQADPDHFGYTLAATVEGAAFTSRVVGATRVRLEIKPTTSYTIWFTAASRINAPGFDSVARSRAQLAAVRSTGYAATLAAYRAWWHGFWAKSFVQYSNASGDADYLENVYYLATYMIAAGGYGNYPMHFINGVFRATQDTSKWSSGYWYWNQRDIYHSFLAGNHPDLTAGLNRLYSRNAAALRALTKSRYSSDGIWTPETMGWNGNARSTVNSDFVNDIYSTGAEAAYQMYLQYRYTADDAYLRETAYPFMRDVVRLYEDLLEVDTATGLYTMASSNAHETYWDVRNAITDLAAVRLLFPLVIDVSERLGLDAGRRAGWRNIVDHLAPYQVQNGAFLPHDPPAVQSRNGENVALEVVWPYDRTGIGHPDQQTAIKTWNTRPHPYDNIWANDHVHAARLGLGEQAFQGMKTMLRKYQDHPNGMTSNTNGGFEYLGVHLTAMNESLLQSYNDKIRVFPAVPAGSDFAGRFTLLAKDGFQVSSEREAGQVKYIGLRSLHGKPARVVNPWAGESVRVRRTSDNAVVATGSATELGFTTTAGTTYVVERVAKPLSEYSTVTLRSTANSGEKSLSGTAATLGLDRRGSLVNNTLLTYDKNWALTTDRGLGDYNDDVHYSVVPGATASYTFTGTGVEYLSERNGDMGPVDVYLDGVVQATVDLRKTGAREVQQVVFSGTGMTNGTHTIRIVNKSTSVGMVDALRIIVEPEVPVVVPGGTVPPVRSPGRTGAVGVTFGTSDGTINTGPYEATTNPNRNYNRPMYRGTKGDLDSFWTDYVDQMLTAGVDYVAFNLRGYLADQLAPPNGTNLGGDPRLLSGLVAAIRRKNASGTLKIAALDDTPGSLTAARNLAENRPGDEPFDVSDPGNYKYFWDLNQREFFKQVPADMRFTMDGRPVIFEWSMNAPWFSHQYGNESKLIRYARARAREEFGVDPYYVVDHSWISRDPTVIGQIDGVHDWFSLPTLHTKATFEPIANNDLLTYSAGWSARANTGRDHFKGDLHTSSTAGASVSYSFYGTGVEYIAETDAGLGSVDVYLDDRLQSSVALNTSTTPKPRQTVYRKTGLTDGLHTIKVVNRSATSVNVDGFGVVSERSAAVRGRSYGVVTPGFSVVTDQADMVVEPDHGRLLTRNLQNTVDAGADLTLLEGMTDWEENALIARTAEGTYAERRTDYPNQMLGIVRQFSKDPFPADLRIEAETADAVTGASPGNGGVYREGDLDVEVTGDAGGGWNVGDVRDGQTITWQSRPLQGTVDLSVRVATPNEGTQLRIVIDGVRGPTVTVPKTGGWQTYTTVPAGSFSFQPGTHHQVTIEFPRGGLNVNYWTAIRR